MGPEPVLDRPDIPGIQIWGWMSSVELKWLAARAAEMQSVVEIGCLHGRSAYAMLTTCPGPVFCIDPWNDEGSHSYPSFMGNCGGFPNLVALQGFSLDVAARFDRQVEMTFIDGSHAYESVLADISAWLPHTTRLICGHDYSNADGGFPGVSKAVDEIFGDRVRLAEGCSIWTVDLAADRTVSPDAPTGALAWTDEYGAAYEYTLRW